MSITYKLFDNVIVYPPAPGDPGGPCLDERCGHFDCIQMRKAAAALCPTCVQPAGYGNAMRMKPVMGYLSYDNAVGERVRSFEDTGFREVTNEHEACYQARLARERADAEAQAQQDAAASDALTEAEAQGEALTAGERELDA